MSSTLSLNELNAVIEVVEKCGLPIPFSNAQLLAHRENLRLRVDSEKDYLKLYSVLSRWVDVDFVEIRKQTLHLVVAGLRLAFYKSVLNPPKQKSFLWSW